MNQPSPNTLKPSQWNTPRPRFALGQIVATPGALALGVDFLPYLVRHVCGDWGDLCEFDKQQNETAVQEELRILSSYIVDGKGRKLWVITESDRSVTTCLLPQEY